MTESIQPDGKPKRKTRSYKTEYKVALADAAKWKQAFKGAIWVIGALLVVIFFGDKILNLIL